MLEGLAFAAHAHSNTWLLSLAAPNTAYLSSISCAMRSRGRVRVAGCVCCQPAPRPATGGRPGQPAGGHQDLRENVARHGRHRTGQLGNLNDGLGGSFTGCLAWAQQGRHPHAWVCTALHGAGGAWYAVEGSSCERQQGGVERWRRTWNCIVRHAWYAHLASQELPASGMHLQMHSLAPPTHGSQQGSRSTQQQSSQQPARTAPGTPQASLRTAAASAAVMLGALWLGQLVQRLQLGVWCASGWRPAVAPLCWPAAASRPAAEPARAPCLQLAVEISLWHRAAAEGGPFPVLAACSTSIVVAPLQQLEK